MMAIHEAKENFGNRRCRSDRSWRSFPEGRFSFSNVRIRDLSVLKEDLTGNRVGCRTSIGRSGNRSKPGETQAVRLPLQLSQKRGSVREDASLQNQLRKRCSGRWPGIEHNTRRQMHGRENRRWATQKSILPTAKKIFTASLDRATRIRATPLQHRKTVG